jgi:hypothetical protein
MRARLRTAGAALCIASHVLPGSRLEAQRLETTPVTVQYPGIGPLTFTPVAGIKAMLANPRIKDGARVVCFDVRYKCDIGVQARTLGDYARPAAEWLAEMHAQFRTLAAPPPDGAPIMQVVTPQGIEVSFSDLRSNVPYRYTAMAVVFRGPAVLKVFAQGPDSAAVAMMMQLARTAKPEAAQEMQAAQLVQFVTVCNSRVPATQAANTRALANSPFRDAVVLGLLRQRDSTMTLEKLLAARSERHPQFLLAYDMLTPTGRQTFCSDLPKTIAVAARELRMP